VCCVRGFWGGVSVGWLGEGLGLLPLTAPLVGQWKLCCARCWWCGAHPRHASAEDSSVLHPCALCGSQVLSSSSMWSLDTPAGVGTTKGEPLTFKCRRGAEKDTSDVMQLRTCMPRVRFGQCW
jgi:hypothetical protein